MLLLLALLLSASVPGRALTPNGPHPDLPPQRDILLNGLRVAVVERPGDRVAVVCALRAGAMFDPVGKSGLANLTAGLMLRGAGSYTAERLKGEIDDAQATLSIRTEWDATWIEAEAPSSKLSVVLDVMSLMVSAPRFAAEDVEALKKDALAHVSAELGDPNTLADRAFAKALYGVHTYGRSIWGDATSIASLSRGDVQVFYDKFYGANSAVLTVAGPVTLDATIELARPRFGRLSKKKVVPATFLPPATPADTRVFVVDRPNTPEPIVRAGFWTAGRTSADATSISYLADALCGELRDRIRTRDGVAASYDPRALQSPFVVRYAVPAGELASSIAAITTAVTETAPGGSGCPHAAASAGSDVVRAARSAAAADFYSAQSLASDASTMAPDATKLAAARAVLKPAPLTVVVVGDAKQITSALGDRFKVEVIPAT